MLDQYREDLETFIHIKAFTKAKEIVESDKRLVFITGDPRSGKTTVARQLVVQLFDEYDSFTYYDLTCSQDFSRNFFADVKYIFFMNDMDFNKMNEWSNSKFETKFKKAIKGESKFVFAGRSVAFKEALKRSGSDNFCKYLCDGVINLSDQEFELSKDKKQEMIKKHVEMGDNDGSAKHNLLNMLSDAAEIECPYFPLVAKSLGLRHCLGKCKATMPPITRVSSFAVQAMPPEDNQESLEAVF